MSIQERAYIDVICDHDGCDAEATAWTDSGWAVGDDWNARQDAGEYGWQHTADGRDLCPDHAVPASEEGTEP